MQSLNVVAIVGPTATGKSELAIAVAQRLHGEVVNADAMQLYRGMDIGTAKLAPQQWGGVPHHVFDLWEVTQQASVAEYQIAARAAIDAINRRGRLVVLVGGSGLYVQGALDQLEFPGTDPLVRARLEAELSELGSLVMHSRLAQRDPRAAAQILPNNGRRIVRALEVMELTGAPFTASLPKPIPHYRTVYIGLDRAADILDARVNSRVDQMWESGLVAEVTSLISKGLREGPTASRALGYAQVLRMLAGELPESAAKADTQQATRRFVRRQRSWFRRDKRINWFDAGEPQLLAQVLTQVPAHSRLGLE